MGTDYTEIARKQITAERAARAEAEIADRATQLRLKDERELQLAELRAKHGLPDHATLRQMADADIDCDRRLRDYLAHKTPQAAWLIPGEHVPLHVAELLSPSIVADPVRQAKVADIRARLVRKFETEVYPAAVAARLAQPVEDATDAATQARSHNMVAA